MSPRSVGRTVLARVWMPLVAVVALAFGALCMWKVHQMSAPGPVVTVNGPAAPPEFNRKQLTYELFGSVGDGGMLVYVDVDGHPASGQSHGLAVVAHRDDHADRGVRQHLGAGSWRSSRLPDVGEWRCPR